MDHTTCHLQTKVLIAVTGTNMIFDNIFTTWSEKPQATNL